jgi:DNA invertase Pin-like site-specific DNA recombinase
LCWGTKKQNAGDRKRHSGYKCTRIPTEQIERGRRLYEMGISRETIAKAVGCDVRTIRRYIKKENWERNIGQNPRVGRPNHRLQQAAAG